MNFLRGVSLSFFCKRATSGGPCSSSSVTHTLSLPSIFTLSLFPLFSLFSLRLPPNLESAARRLEEKVQEQAEGASSRTGARGCVIGIDEAVLHCWCATVLPLPPPLLLRWAEEDVDLNGVEQQDLSRPSWICISESTTTLPRVSNDTATATATATWPLLPSMLTLFSRIPGFDDNRPTLAAFCRSSRRRLPPSRKSTTSEDLQRPPVLALACR